MRKLKITEDQKREILTKHGFLKENSIEEQILSPQQSAAISSAVGQEKEKETFLKAIEAKCLPGPQNKIKKGKSGKLIYVDQTKSGKDVYFYADMSWKLSDGTKSGKWACAALSTPTPPKNSTTPITPKTVVPAGIQPSSVQPLTTSTGPTKNTTAKSESDDILDQVTESYELGPCTRLVDDYFEKAQVGAPDKLIEQRKEKIKFCNNKNRASWKEDTKDKLRWLTGREEDAKKIFGLFKKFPKIGNIGDTPERREWRLSNIPQI